MKIVFIFLLVPFIVFSQTKNKIIEYNNSIALPFNQTTNAVLNFNMALLQGAPIAELIKKRNAVLESLNSLDKVLSEMEPMPNDYGLHKATKEGSRIYKTYFKENYTNEHLSKIPSDANDNIKKIEDAKESGIKMDLWNKEFSKRQKQLFIQDTIVVNIDSSMLQRAAEHNAAMNYYFEVVLNELKVQVFVDDFVSAFNANQKEKIKVAHTNLKAQLILSDQFLNSSKPYKGDDSLLKSSAKVLGFYKKLSNGLIPDVIQLNSFPDSIPNDRVDEYKGLLEKVNTGVKFLNTLQTQLNESQIVVNMFFQSHLY